MWLHLLHFFMGSLRLRGREMEVLWESGGGFFSGVSATLRQRCSVERLPADWLKGPSGV